MSRSALLSIVSVLLIALNVSVVLGVEPAGSRPMNVAVSPDGNTIIATSMGSTSITQAKWNGSDYDVSSIDVGAPSWGVVFVHANVIVLTHPDATGLSVLSREDAESDFEEDHGIELGEQFRYSTELIARPGTKIVYVANRGMPLSGQESWTNAVFRVNVETDQITGTIVTEREPRALALSPNSSRLYVGHVQGSLGGAPLVSNNSLADNYQSGTYLGDGGSILVYDISTWNEPEQPVSGQRIGVGSPVRGLACSGNTNGTYVVYFTSVGDNANSEDPETSPEIFGGREIPNVVNALTYNSSHVLQSFDRAVFSHKPDWDPTTSFPPLEGFPAVLPDKIVIRDFTVSGQRNRELWVTNSGSGTLSRTPLDSDGGIQTTASFEPVLPIRLTRNANNEFTIEDNLGILLPVLQVITNQAGTVNVSHVNLSRVGHSMQFSSNTRAIAYSSATDKVWVATQFDNEIIQVTGNVNSTTITQRLNIGAAVENSEERNFFGFGRGFFFREDHYPDMPEKGDVPKVGNQTCATCHVDGHSDGKVRLTKRRADNKLTSNSRRKPVAVPSCFDVGDTEWIFFEGLRTIVDGQFGLKTSCAYCDAAGFFDNTEAFTNDLISPRSPHNWQGTLSGNTLRGRYVFEAMNCSRCHMGSPDTFTRSLETSPMPLDPEGPITSTNQFLHDFTQVFISRDTGTPDDASLRNMTDVGTRAAGDGFAVGIHTPALAGVWDNRPYMHDGRYRTLDEVLANTWLEEDEGFQAAPLVPHPKVPDNAFDDVINNMLPVKPRLPLHPFHTHSPAMPDTVGWTSVATKLSPTDYADLKAFLLSLSSQTDPCTGGATDYIPNLNVNGSTVSWTTPVNVTCDVTWSGPTQFAQRTAWSTSHSSSMPSPPPGTYTVKVKPRVRPVCGFPDSGITQVVIPGGQSTPVDALPVITEMSPSRPNPFNPTTSIAFSLAKDDHVSLAVFDAAGRLVRSLVNDQRKRDRYSVVWDGTDDRGAPVASGVYFCRMIAGSYRSTQKLVLLK